MGTLLGVLTAAILCGAPPARAQEPTDGLSAPVREAGQLLTSRDQHPRRGGVLRLEALGDPAALPHVQPHLTARSVPMRAAAVRAVTALQGLPAVPMLLKALAS